MEWIRSHAGGIALFVTTVAGLCQIAQSLGGPAAIAVQDVVFVLGVLVVVYALARGTIALLILVLATNDTSVKELAGAVPETPRQAICNGVPVPTHFEAKRLGAGDYAALCQRVDAADGLFRDATRRLRNGEFREIPLESAIALADAVEDWVGAGFSAIRTAYPGMTVDAKGLELKLHAAAHQNLESGRVIALPFDSVPARYFLGLAHDAITRWVNIGMMERACS